MASIGIFDSGYGGLTVFKAIVAKMPDYNYIYLGDNARAPYGNRSFETVYQYTLECVQWLFDAGCDLVILACNTASAKALRTIQQNDLPKIGPEKRVLGVIRPTAEIIHQYSRTNHIGILGTSGTVASNSYVIEMAHFAPEIQVSQHACPLWVPLVEANAYQTDAAKLIIRSDVEQLLLADKAIDTILLACTHYPILKPIIQQFVPESVNIISQGELVADSLEAYLKRHSETETGVDRKGDMLFYTTGEVSDFEAHASLFFGKDIKAQSCNVVKK
ncbi:glutamate racemase [Taibaiella sp. KBW10]|uniref:glutamate racemase n=1 Tax=Taibaiella sp. KBW10 TaxID=2153357 RepID=UPI000F5B1E5A|nr:glutamate racemase [Taibaiella sp. KBW10]RQO30129.1 glutamate racemase [Taibaiella sp. KBW10]